MDRNRDRVRDGVRVRDMAAARNWASTPTPTLNFTLVLTLVVSLTLVDSPHVHELCVSRTLCGISVTNLYFHFLSNPSVEAPL